MKKLGNKIVKISDVDPETMSLKIYFSDGFSFRLSLRDLFSKPKGLTAEIMRGGLFGRCFVESGALAWPNGFELCPDALRQWAEAQHAPNARRAA